MRRLAVLGMAIGLVLVSGCGGPSARPTAQLMLSTPRAGEEHLQVPAWRLPEAGRVMAIGAAGGRVRVAQARAVSEIGSGRDSTVLLEVPAGERVVALSPRGTRVAVGDGEGVRAGRVESFDPESTQLSGFDMSNPVLAFDRHPARVLAGDLWDLDVPGRVWLASVYSVVSASLGPAGTSIALGDEEGVVSVVSAGSGKSLRRVPRSSRVETAPEVVATAIGPDGALASLDRAGWVSCGGGSVAALPLAPAGLPAALAFAGSGVWAARGGRAVHVSCGGSGPAVRCEARGADGDPRSAALLAAGNRVYAAGLAHGRVVGLPRCP